MIDPLSLFIGTTMAFSAVPSIDRPRFTTMFSCALAMTLSKDEFKKYSLDPKRFHCVQEESGMWIIKGKERNEP